MLHLSQTEERELIVAIATREGTARELANQWNTTKEDLTKFTELHLEEIELARDALERQDPLEVTPTELSELWITKKGERLRRYQLIADHLFEECLTGVDSTALREFRSYGAAAANELGQLLHRGAGDAGTDSLDVQIQGVNLDELR